MPQIAQGNFTGMITAFRNQSIILGMQPCVDIIYEIVGNDEFQNRAGTDDSTKAHMIQLIDNADRVRRLITYNPEKVDLKSVIDPTVSITDAPSLSPISLDTIQLSSTPQLELPWQFDGSDPNIPIWSELQFRNGVGGVLYGAASQILVQYTRLESRNRSHMITVNDSLRVYSVMKTFLDLCENRLGEANQVDIAQPLASDEPENNPPPNRVGNKPVVFGTSLQNSQSQPS